MPSTNMYVPRYDPRGNQIHSEHPAGHPSVFQPTAGLNYSLPTDVATLHSIINNLLELQATTTANTHLAACLAIARVQTEQALPTPTTTTTTSTTTTTTTSTTNPNTPNNTPNDTPNDTTTAPLPCPHPNHSCIAASGRGAASPEVFKEVIKINWHGRLGRTHMVDVDALSEGKLAELDSFLRQKLDTFFPPGVKCPYSATTDSDKTFETLASVGLRLEDRRRYGEKNTGDSSLLNQPTLRRVTDYTAWYYSQQGIENYWRGFALETISELARYRGLFNDKGFLKPE